MTTRSSDFMLSHLKAFADATGDARWLKIRDRTYDIMNDIRQRYSAKTGLMPVFWVTSAMVSTRGMQRVIRGAWRWTNCSMASRVPASLIPLNQWARKITRDNPERFADSYGLGGRTLPDHGNNSLAFISALGVSARIDSGNQQWINAIWNDMAGQTITDDDYYGNTLKLLSMVVLSGHWKEP